MTFRRNKLTIILSGAELGSGGVILKTGCVVTQKFIVFSFRCLFNFNIEFFFRKFECLKVVLKSI